MQTERMSLAALISNLVFGLAIGGAARFAVPGPDPMPMWLTATLGLLGSMLGGIVSIALYGSHHVTANRNHVFVTLLLEIAAAALLLILYRRFVQHRPITGPGAEKFPERGIGIERMREGFRRAGIDPDDPMGSIQARLSGQKHEAKTPEAHPDHGDELEKLKELHDQGVLTDDEYAAARERLRRY
jgi:uncharacterized membrane protein YeaQ/YmgE (transglycosylase-associated protein family)